MIKKANANHRRHKQIQLLQQCKHDSKSLLKNFEQIGLDTHWKLNTDAQNQVINAEGEVLSERSGLLQVWKGYFAPMYDQSSLSVPSIIL